MPKHKVLFVISTLKFGGAEKQTIDLINHLDTSRIETTLCYLEREEYLKEELISTQVSRLHCLEKKNKIDFGVLKKLQEVISEIKPEIIISVDPYPGLYAHMARFFSPNHFRIIQIVHSTISPNLYYDIIIRLLYRHLINRSDNVVFVCKNQMDYWINHYGIRPQICRYVFNGIDTDHFTDVHSSMNVSQIRQSLGFNQSDILLCMCASFRPEKRHVDLIDAGRLLIDKGYQVRLLLVGDGVERKHIERHMQKTGMATSVAITGFQRDVRPYIAASDVVVMPSTETFSIAILEAMAMGKPIIASNIGGASEQVLDGLNGFLFPAGDIEALADKLEIMIERKLFRAMGERSRSLVVDRFTSRQMVDHYQELLSL